MTTTLLQLIKDACDVIGLARPSAVVGATDPQVRRLQTYSSQEGRDLMRSSNWTVLQRLHTFSTVSSQAEYSLPSDFDRIIQNTEWDRSRYEPLYGPLSPQRWQAIKSGLLGSGVVGRRYRVLRSDSSVSRTIRIDPTPDTSGETLAFEYISGYWCKSDGGTAQSDWAADDDVTLFNRDLHMLGVVVRYKRARGLDYASEADEHANMMGQLTGQDRPSPTLSMAPRPHYGLLGWQNLPETGLGS